MKWAVVMSEFAPICIYLVISLLVSLISLGLTAFALVFHLFHGVRHFLPYVRKIILDFEGILYCTFCTSRSFRIARFYLSLFFLLFLIFRTGCTLIALCLKAFAIPVAYANIDLLAFYLHLPGQDPEWVRYVWNDIAQSTGHADLEARVARFLAIEQACSTRRQIQSLVSLYSARCGYLIPKESIDFSVMEILEKENWEFDRQKLGEILESLALFRTESPFFQKVWMEDGDYLRQMHLLELKRLGLYI